MQNKKLDQLEDIVDKKDKPKFQLDELPDYLKVKNDYENKKEREKENNGVRDIRLNAGGDEVFWVSRYSLPSGVGWRARGVKYVHAKRVEIDYNEPNGNDSFVYHHEEAHSLGVINERACDKYASSA